MYQPLVRRRPRWWLSSVTIAVSLVSLISILLIVRPLHADGTEELGPPQGITIAKGSGMIAAGIGISTTLPTDLNITVPSTTTVKQVLLYWSGGMVDDNRGSDTVTISGQTITGKLIGGPTFFFREDGDEVFFSAFRADITNLGLVKPGANTLSVESQPFIREKDGVGVMVIYDDGSGDARIEVRDGLDVAYWDFPEPRRSAVPQTFTFPATTQERSGRMSMFFGSVSPEIERSSFVTITVDSTVAVVEKDVLSSQNGPQWDTLNIDFVIPAGSTSVTVTPLSPPNADPDGASFSWISSGFHLLEPAQGDIDLKKFTNDADADRPSDTDVPALAVGAPVTWTYIVTNTGTISYTEAEVAVTDSHASVTPLLIPSSDDGDEVLAPGESWLYEATGVAEDLEAPGSGTTVVDGCGATGDDPGRATYRNVGRVEVPDASATDPSHYCNPPAPDITLQKHTNNADADSANGTDVPLLSPGQSVTWSYYITNTGNVPFTQASVNVTDSHASVTPVLVSSSDDGDQILSPGESWTYRATGVAADLTNPTSGMTVVNGCGFGSGSANQNAYENVGQVTVPDATASDPSHYCNPTPTALNAIDEPTEASPSQTGEYTTKFYMPLIADPAGFTR